MTENGYCVVARRWETVRMLKARRAMETLWSPELPREEDLYGLRARSIHPVILYAGEDGEWLLAVQNLLLQENFRFTILTLEEAEESGDPVAYIENRLTERGLVSPAAVRSVCGNCGATLEGGQRYCRECGTRRGEGSFRPQFNHARVVYGPPITVTFRCRRCGRVEEIMTLGGAGSAHCPDCGLPMDKSEARRPRRQ